MGRAAGEVQIPFVWGNPGDEEHPQGDTDNRGENRHPNLPTQRVQEGEQVRLLVIRNFVEDTDSQAGKFDSFWVSSGKIQYLVRSTVLCLP